MKKKGAENWEDGGRQGGGGRRCVHVIEAGGLARSEGYGGGKGQWVEGGGGKEANRGSQPVIIWMNGRP